MFFRFLWSVWSDSQIQLPVKNGTKVILKGLVLKALQDGSEEAAHDELGSLLRRNAAGHHVKELILVQLT